jgi:hypothetical protein
MSRPEYYDRHIDVYTPTASDKRRWGKLAEDAGIQLSKWIYETVELHLDEEQPNSRLDVIGELAQLREDKNKLRDELKLKSLLIEKYETELFKLRHNAFDQPELIGKFKFNSDLVDIIRQGGVWSDQDLLKSMHIDQNDIDAMKILSRQLEELQAFGLVESGSRGWRWIK